ncbi:hypothetical protein Taro_001606 [Colocasia esculenta]|uniref:Uncharacterized protein n=1 Tax=Colocasia esculenta TaxID=4460 RepID=A0A843TGP4_COLES|nr:hypothetical protein [Colocasia esculenta]
MEVYRWRGRSKLKTIVEGLYITVGSASSDWSNWAAARERGAWSGDACGTGPRRLGRLRWARLLHGLHLPRLPLAGEELHLLHRAAPEKGIPPKLEPHSREDLGKQRKVFKKWRDSPAAFEKWRMAL